MAEVTMSLTDKRRSLHQVVSREFAAALVAALSADPETIEELHQALVRFWDFTRDAEFVTGWSEGTPSTSEHCSTGVVDLADRIVTLPPEMVVPSPHGCIQYLDADSQAKVQLWFQLSDEWLVGDAAKTRATKRPRQFPGRDHRRVLYEEVVGYAARHSVVSARDGDLGQGEAAANGRLVSEIHASWLLTPRDSLGKRTPRDVLLEKRELIDFDLQSRRDQWSILDRCPPGLLVNSRAYQFAGFGSHEVILYYDLVRHLLWEAVEQVMQNPSADEAAVERSLSEAKNRWLNTASHGVLEGNTPRAVLENERRRIPLAISGTDASIDCDCPLCQMMAENGPVFLHLDGCHIEDEFAFSFHRTQREWDLERREWDQIEREWEAESQRGRLQNKDMLPSRNGRGARSDGTRLLLVAIAACLTELGSELLSSDATAPIAASLNSHFGNLREVAREGTTSLVRPVISKLSHELEDVAGRRMDLGAKCTELQRHLATFARQLDA